jgi:hypothetical protein
MQKNDKSTSPLDTDLQNLRRSSSNQDFVSQIREENQLLLKSIPKGYKPSNEIQRMIKGKCSLKELLKSAATRN